jgi:NADH-quinone oxidoreductase subunit B
VAAVDLPAPRTGSAADHRSGLEPLVVDTGRGYSLWVVDAGLACCAVECAAALRRAGGPGAGHDDGSRAAGGAGRGGGRGGGGRSGERPCVLIVAGTVTDKLAPLVLGAYERMPDPRYVISFGACSNSGGPYWDSYCVTKGVDQFVPVDVYVPGCPPRPEALLHGLDVLEERCLTGERP